MKGKIRGIGHLRSHTRLFLLFIITFMVPLVVLSVIFIHSYAQLITESTHTAVLDNHDQINSAVNAQLRTIEVAGNMLYVDGNLIESLDDYRNGRISAETCSARISEVVDRLNPYFDSIKPEIAVADENGKILGGNYLEHYFRFPELESYLEDYCVKRGVAADTEWLLDCDLLGTDSGKINSIYAFHQIRGTNGRTSSGTVIFRIRKNDLARIFLPLVNDYQSVYLLSADGQVVVREDTLEIGESLVSRYGTELEKYDSTVESRTEMGTTLLRSTTMDTTLWHVVSVSALDQVLSGYNRVNRNYYIALLVCAALSLLMAYFFSRRFTKPIVDLHNQLKRLEQGDLNAHAQTRSNDEIGELTVQFNSAVDKIQDLMNQLVAEQEDKRKADIQALQTQINPHFIFNTLTSVRYLIFSDKRENADSIIVALNKLMKYALSDAQSMVSVNLEMEQLNNYLSIQRYSLAEDFTPVIRVDPEIGNCMIMKLLLQPIVENSILHGLKLKKGKQELIIEGRAQGEDLEFTVRDNGVGFDLATLEEKMKKSGNNGNSIGIANVNKRIKLHFGSRYGVNLESRINEGTTVTIRVPRITNEEGCWAYDYFAGR